MPAFSDLRNEALVEAVHVLANLLALLGREPRER
jgi:hypothetical protein